MSFDKETLYKLLPAFDRLRDIELADPTQAEGKGDGPMKALLGLIAEQMAVLEENLDQLYDDQFIETCAEWVVPYIGEMVTTRGLVVFPNAPFSNRAQVANTISYRRRKGTAAMLEQLAHDVTGWSSNVVEYFQLLATTQYMNHLRPQNLSISGLKDWEKMEYVNTPFDKLAHTADVRRIEPKRGKYNIPNVGIFLWRLGAYSSINAPAYKVDDRRYKFDPLGKDIQLYNMPVSEDEISHLAEPINVPAPISRMVMYKYPERYYGNTVLVYRDGTAAPASNICICNLSDTTDGTGNWRHMPIDKVAIDPVLGRIALPALASPPLPSVVHVNFHYGFSDKTGGGDYGRIETFSTELEKINKIKVPDAVSTISAAIAALQSTGGVIEITNNEYYVETPVINMAAGKKIELRAADAKRPVLVLANDFIIGGDADSEVYINGLLISGACVRVPQTHAGNNNQLKVLQIHHCTLAPGKSRAIQTVPEQPPQPRLVIEMPGVNVIMDRCITGPIRSNDEAEITITNSIVDALDENSKAYAGLNSAYGAPLHIENSTVIGRVATRIMQLASNTVFLADGPLAVEAQRLQEGCVRFSYIPPGSRLPAPHECQPKSAEDAARVRPLFHSLEYGKADYCQLSAHCAIEIKQGADNGAEMGAFCNLYQPQREANLRTRLNEYLRFGLEAGIFYGS